MIDDQAVKEIKGHFLDYLNEQGINTNRLFNCLNPAHEDTHPSMSYDSTKNIVHCFSCNSNYDIISLYAIQNNLDNNKDFKKIIEELAKKYNVNIKATKKATNKNDFSVSQQKKDFTRS